MITQVINNIDQSQSRVKCKKKHINNKNTPSLEANSKLSVLRWVTQNPQQPSEETGACNQNGLKIAFKNRN